MLLVALESQIAAPCSHAAAAARETNAWPTWEAPRWHERVKPAYEALRDLWGSW